MNISNAEKKRLQSAYGDWALVTGASSGIGQAIAKGLAASGIHVVLTARRQAILENFANTLATTYTVQTKVIAADLSIEEEVSSLLKATAALPIGLAVFAAGYGTSGAFKDSNLEEELNMLQLNCKALLMGVHHYIQQFNTRGSGGIILLSSLVGFQGSPYVAHYAATKAYVQSLGEALALELKSAQIDVLTVAPGPVDTEFADRAQLTLNTAATPEEVALASLKALGKKNTIFPGKLAKIMALGLSILPRWGKIRVMKKVMGKAADAF